MTQTMWTPTDTNTRPAPSKLGSELGYSFELACVSVIGTPCCTFLVQCRIAAPVCQDFALIYVLINHLDYYNDNKKHCPTFTG